MPHSGFKTAQKHLNSKKKKTTIKIIKLNKK